jgi:hypothetical protein
MNIRIQCSCVDSRDPRFVASFWEVALGWRRTFDEPDRVCLEPPAGSPEDGIAPDILFLRVPEGTKTVSRTGATVSRHMPQSPAARGRGCTITGGAGADRRQMGWLSTSPDAIALTS